MRSKLEILIVEDDEIACRELIDEIDKNPEDFFLINYTNNSLKAFDLVMETQPDAVILDLELHRGGGSGLDFLKKVQEAALDHPPYILITTNNISAITHKTARGLGADFILTKTQEGYSAKDAFNLLKATKSVILSRKSDKKPFISNENSAQAEKRVLKLINEELLRIGINPKCVGFKYLSDAIALTIKGPIQHICNVIGKKYKKTESSVERAMQNAINRTWNVSDINELLKLYTARIGSDKGTPTVTEFIFYYANKVQNSL